VIRHIGPSLDPIPEGSWMTFTPHPELPGFPTHTFDTFHKDALVLGAIATARGLRFAVDIGAAAIILTNVATLVLAGTATME